MTGRAGTTDLEVTETGRGEDLVVFVHGVLDRGRSFDRVAALLEDRCRMLWYDRRGYAGSIGAPGAPVDVDGHTDDLLAVIGDRRVTVVGHSFGGVTVLNAALRSPRTIDGIVLYETGMAWVPGWDDTHMRDLLWSEDPERAGLAMMLGDRVDRLDADARDRRLREARAFVVEERAVRTGEAPFDLSQLTQPLLYAHGEGSHFAVVSDHLRTVVPDVEVEVIAGAGHNAHRSHPDELARLVHRVLDRRR